MPTEPLATQNAPSPLPNGAPRATLDAAGEPKLGANDSPYRLRAFQGERDLAELVRLFNDCAAQSPTENRTDRDELRADLARPEIEAENVALLLRHERLVGFAAILTHRGPHEILADLWLKATRSAENDASRRLVDWAETRSRELSRLAGVPLELLTMVDEDRADCVNLLQREEFVVGRHFARMERPLGAVEAEVDSPPGFSIRPLRMPFELPQWIDALNATFADHWRFSPKSLDQAVHFRDNDPNSCGDGDFVAIAPDGSLAGFCQCVIRASENELSGRREGWISLLGVVPSYRRIGLGGKLLAQGLRWLTNEGLTSAALNVDAASPTGAFRLYESAGFATSRRRLALVRRYAPSAVPLCASPDCVLSTI